MKKIYIVYIITIASISVLLACKKNTFKAPYNLTTNQAFLKINYASADSTWVQLKINDERVSSNIVGRTPFPGGGLNTAGSATPDYLAVNPGNMKFSLSIPKARTNIDSILLYTTNVNVEGGKYYTLHVTDTAPNIQSVLIPEDIVNSPDSGFSKYRFVHLMPNVPAIDLYFDTTIVARNIPYKGVGPFFNLKFPNPNKWAVRPAGAPRSTTTALAIYEAGFVPNQRIFTVFAMGYNGTNVLPRKPYVSLIYNR